MSREGIVPRSDALILQAALEREDSQAGDAVEVTGVVRADRIAKFQSARADDQVGERQIHSVSRLLAANPGDDLGSDLCHRVGTALSAQSKRRTTKNQRDQKAMPDD
jgi:hypothetical protein